MVPLYCVDKRREHVSNGEGGKLPDAAFSPRCETEHAYLGDCGGKQLLRKNQRRAATQGIKDVTQAGEI